MDVVVAFIANGEATKPVEPGERALDSTHASSRSMDGRRQRFVMAENHLVLGCDWGQSRS
jgi:hypothetical protein